MTHATSARWKLVVQFDDHKTQAERDPELAFPNDEASRFVRELSGIWALIPEDLTGNDALVQFTDDRVTTYADDLDSLRSPMDWLVMSTIPKSIQLTRLEYR